MTSRCDDPSAPGNRGVGSHRSTITPRRWWINVQTATWRPAPNRARAQSAATGLSDRTGHRRRDPRRALDRARRTVQKRSGSPSRISSADASRMSARPRRRRARRQQRPRRRPRADRPVPSSLEPWCGPPPSAIGVTRLGRRGFVRRDCPGEPIISQLGPDEDGRRVAIGPFKGMAVPANLAPQGPRVTRVRPGGIPRSTPCISQYRRQRSPRIIEPSRSTNTERTAWTPSPRRRDATEPRCLGAPPPPRRQGVCHP